MKKLSILALSFALVGCTTVQVPFKRPMDKATQEKVGATAIAHSENSPGVGKSWFMQDSSAAGAQYGLIGGITTAIIDAIVNAGPQRRATRAADEMYAVLPPEELNARFMKTMTAASTSDSTMTINAASVDSYQPLFETEGMNDALNVGINYTLSEDGSALRVLAVAEYKTDAFAYQTPYTFEKSVPKSETEGPIYRNRFTYESNRLELPVLNDDVKAELVASIEDAYRDEDGNLPVEGDSDYKKMSREIDDANDDELSKSEAAFFLVSRWTANDGALLKQEVDAAHSFFAKYILIDMNSTAVPSLEGTDEVVETMADKRVVRMIGSGTEAGSYISSPGDLSATTTYGNAVALAPAARENMSALRKEAKSRK